MWPEPRPAPHAGSAVLVSALGNHSIALEMMDAMQKGSQYIPAYFGGWLWSALLVLPHSIAVNYAFPLTIGKNGECWSFACLVVLNTLTRAELQWVRILLSDVPSGFLVQLLQASRPLQALSAAHIMRA